MSPPNAASRRAASRSTRASRPILTNAVFSVSPVYSRAKASNGASMLSVVLICMNMHAGYASCQFARRWIPVRVGFAEGQTIRVAHRPDGQAFLRITRNDGQAVVAPPVCHPARESSRRPPFCLVSYFQRLHRSGRGYSHTTSPCLLPRPSSCFDFFVVSESIALSDCLGGKALLEASHTFKPVEPLAISRLGGYSSVGRASRSQ